MTLLLDDMNNNISMDIYVIYLMPLPYMVQLAVVTVKFIM